MQQNMPDIKDGDIRLNIRLSFFKKLVKQNFFRLKCILEKLTNNINK